MVRDVVAPLVTVRLQPDRERHAMVSELMRMHADARHTRLAGAPRHDRVRLTSVVFLTRSMRVDEVFDVPPDP